MRRGMLLCVVVGAAMVVLGVPGAALAGGGCHSGVTENDATGEEDATVRMIDACFTATVTTVDPGSPVTFANTDLGVTHNVGGNQWGHFEDMIEGDAFTVTFDEPGVYPFACNYHPGMTGAIVVGIGKGITGSGEPISVQPFEPPANNVTPLPVADAGGIPAGTAVAIGLGGLALGAGVALGVGRLGRTRTAA
ncbi:MAG: cupredoxin domain-containing protein [Actinobacteria bacterium]|nr:cupredoxin domain-containing protein [Actinomycetota bacterium]